jgi:hypothetical protein
MIPLILCIIVVGLIATFSYALDARDPNLRQPCQLCGGEMRYDSPGFDGSAKYRCKACGHIERRGVDASPT